MKKYFRSLLCFFFLLSGASELMAQSDSVKMLSYDDFMNVVKVYHPIVKQADLLLNKADAELLTAKGEFDPRFSYNTEQKTFDGKQYYQTANPQLKIPTWYGIEVKTGTEYYGGDLLNPDITPGKSTYLGISIPLAKNLLLDKRRAQLQQARIMQTQSISERALLVNDLLQDAGIAYWEWSKAKLSLQILQDALQNNETRYKLVLNSALIGERPAIDTVEALMQLNQIRLNVLEAMNKVQMTNAELSNYLWKENNEAYFLSADVLPSSGTLSVQPLDLLLQYAAVNHPKIKVMQQKLLSLNIDRKLKYQDLLPVVNMNANLLNKDFKYSFSKYGSEYARQNNKFGLDFYIPLRLSKERAAYKMSKIKITETTLGLDFTKIQLQNKIIYYYRELEGLTAQVTRCETLLAQSRQLFRAEVLRFTAGESSQFMMNARENKVLEVELKLTELKMKLRQAAVNLNWASARWQ